MRRDAVQGILHFASVNFAQVELAAPISKEAAGITSEVVAQSLTNVPWRKE